LYQFTKRVTILTDNYRRISLPSISYKILSNILLSRSCPYIDEIIGDHQCGFQSSRSTTVRFSALVRYWRKNEECNETVHQLYIDLKKSLRFSAEGYFVQYSLRIRSTDETTQVD
jgi:hypothetical protein